MSRRRLLRTGMGAAAGAAGVALARPGRAGANTGDSVIAGEITLASSGTQLQWNGSSGFTGVLLLGNDTTFSDNGADFPAAAGGWAGGGTAGVANGVYGYTQVAAGNGVVGVSNLVTTGCGVLGTANSAGAVGVKGTNVGGYAVLGQVGSSLPSLPASTSAVAGQAGGSSVGLAVASESGAAVVAVSAHSHGLQGTSSGAGDGVVASSATGYGLKANGGKAQLYLVPAATAGAPTSGSHNRGELFLDKNGALFLCTTSGTPGTWNQLA